MKLAAYVRVSRVMGREGEKFMSPEMQRDAITAWAAAQGHEVSEWYEELDVSGGKLARPQFAAMMDRVRAHAVEGVVAAKLDRFSRSLTGALEAVAELDRLGAEFVSVQDHVDRSSPTGRLMFNMLLSLAEWHLEMTREGWDATLARVVERGVWPSVVPFGYRKRDDGRLEPDPVEAPFVVGIFDRRGRGETWASIAAWLNAEGARPRRASHWTGSTVKDIVRHEVYLGVVAKQGYRNERAHEPLVGRDAWERARNVHQLQPTKPNGDGYLGAGLLRCAGCGYALTGSTYKRKGQAAIRQYVCKRRHGTGECPASASILARIIEPHLERVFFDVVGELELEPHAEGPELVAAEQEARDAQAELTRWAKDTMARDVWGEEAYMAGAWERRERLERAQLGLAEARRRATGIDVPPVVELRELWPDLSRRERRRLIGAAVEVVMVKRGRGPVDERCKVFRRGEAPAGLPSKGRSAPIRTFDF